MMNKEEDCKLEFTLSHEYKGGVTDSYFELIHASTVLNKTKM